MNSKIAKIVRDIQYIKPKGSLEEFKYGVSIKKTVAPAQGVPSENVFEPSFSSLKEEMKKSPQRPTLTEPELTNG